MMTANLALTNTNDQKDDSSPRKFKGIVEQQNGHWGAQIYVNHQRIWLGTFKSKEGAAMAYDSAAIRLRGDDSQRNFTPTSLTMQEKWFQIYYSTEALLNMIRDGSYENRFAEFVRARSSNEEDNLLQFNPASSLPSNRGVARHQLFRKELTPSDVGKLNRLVIPKKYAARYFPALPDQSRGEAEGRNEIQMVFCDQGMRSWSFRYCYWKSSQSFVFTRGWNRFVKDKGLKEKDVVTFYQCEYMDGSEQMKSFCMIDVGVAPSDEVLDMEEYGMKEHEIELGLNMTYESGSDDGKGKGKDDEVKHKEEEGLSMLENGFKLFGVQLFPY